MDGNAAADEVAAGDGVGDMLFHNERGFAKVKGDVRFVVLGGRHIERSWRVVEWGGAM